MMDCLPGRDFVWVGPHGRSVSHGYSSGLEQS
jgi:hypothetical protein